MKNLMLALLLCGTFACLAADLDVPVKKNTVWANPAIKIESFMDEDGTNSMRVSKMLNRATPGNEYIDFFIKLPQVVDMTGKAIKITILSENPENIGGFYVRAYNQSNKKKPASSHCLWSSKSILSKQYMDIVVIPGKNGQIPWESRAITGEAPTAVNQLSIHTGSPKRNVEMNFRIKSVQIIDSPMAETDKFFADFGQFSEFGRSNFTTNTKAEVKDGILRIYGKSPAKPAKPGATMYQGIRIVLASPVDMTGKKIVMEYRVTGMTGGIYLRGKEYPGKKPCFSFVTTRPARDWQTMELPLAGTAAAPLHKETEHDGDLTKFQSLSVIFPITKVNSDGAVEIRSIKIVD